MLRFLRRKRPTSAEPSVAVIDISAFAGQHTAACADFVAVPRPLSPLVTELIALHAHTRHLSWLSEREDCPDEYRLLARSVVRQVLAGWHHQTGGRGTIDDLLTGTDRTHRGESRPATFHFTLPRSASAGTVTVHVTDPGSALSAYEGKATGGIPQG
ncbi:hypothetical protein EYS09_11975 [Streptomyces kasugaensis]|uniref:Uncharacterized protein n=1 Tax=Streptomyces kasugaensis TaxID=1946 RepID=A0A4V2JIQ6_STRKA|nr:hypothetical protein [Streptomyces kasugaensis]TBO59461.1 hypothetical protein EYS09_11975 [Streptomyces kasugaensis]